MEKQTKSAVSHGIILKRILGTVIVAVLAVSAWNCSRNVAAAEEELPQCVASGRIDSLFAGVFGSSDEPGGYVLVMKNDTVVYRLATGLADLETGEPIDRKTRFNVSSASKIFAAAALLKLAEQNRLALGDSLSLYFPEFSENFFRRITLRDILTHSSGLPDLRPRQPAEWSNYTIGNNSVFANADDYRLYGTEEEHMKCFASLKGLEYEPGTHYSRNDPAFILVAPLIEKITGQTFDKWVRDNIFAPAGVPGICYFNPGELKPIRAHAYRLTDASDPIQTRYRSADGKWEEYDYGEAPFSISKADKGAYMTPDEFVLWKRAYYNGKVLNDSSFHAIFHPYIATDHENVSYGLGCAIHLEEGAPVSEYHMNTNGGYTFIECSYPDKRLHFAVFSNRNDWDYRHVTHEMRRILAEANYLD